MYYLCIIYVLTMYYLCIVVKWEQSINRRVTEGKELKNRKLISEKLPMKIWC